MNNVKQLNQVCLFTSRFLLIQVSLKSKTGVSLFNKTEFWDNKNKTSHRPEALTLGLDSAQADGLNLINTALTLKLKD